MAAVRRRWSVLVALFALACAAILVAMFRRPVPIEQAHGVDEAGAATPATGDPAIAHAPSARVAPIASAVHDRATRDDVRRRILEAWAQSPDPAVAAAARDGRFTPMPEDNDASAHYIHEVVREDFFPLAKQCYEELLTRKDAGGRIEMSFAIVGDEKIGGVIDDVKLTVDGGIDDPEMLTCMRESFLSLSFRPPPHGATETTVVYPIELSP
jgi:hypothetical protein